MENPVLIKEGISLTNWTTFRIGGPAKHWTIVKNIKEFKKIIEWINRNGIDYFILGGGSNVLINDQGFNGIVIKNEIDTVEILKKGSKTTQILAGSGTNLSKLIKFSLRNNLSGLEYLVGIPGTVGGAVFGNAEAYGRCFGNVVKEVKAINIRQGTTKNFSLKELNFSYRNSFFKKNSGWFIGEVKIELFNDNSEQSRKIAERILTERKQKIPDGFSAGCIFKNYQLKERDPLLKKFPEMAEKTKKGKISTGYLIEKAGLKGKKINQAIISPQHANFIINLGGAKFEDIRQLINLIKQEVYDKFGIEIEEEIKIY